MLSLWVASAVPVPGPGPGPDCAGGGVESPGSAAALPPLPDRHIEYHGAAGGDAFVAVVGWLAGLGLERCARTLGNVGSSPMLRLHAGGCY